MGAFIIKVWHPQFHPFTVASIAGFISWAEFIRALRGDPYDPYAPLSLSDFHMDGFIDNIRTLSTHGFFAFERKTPTISPIYSGKHSRISITVRINKTSRGDPYHPYAPFSLSDFDMDGFIDNIRTPSTHGCLSFESTTPTISPIYSGSIARFLYR